ncbi:MAG: hypothetical protein KY469_10275 [Actinobacteria bacterium]|nr:hypothetical protein [Actinomycetota bacterium]
MHRVRIAAVTAAAAVGLLVPGVTHADHVPGHGAPNQGPAPNEFADDFEPPLDAEQGYPIGGFGGLDRGAPTERLPVILVHGNTETHDFWQRSESPPTIVNVRQRLLDAGYSEQDVWALSYDGAAGCSTTGCGTANDVNVPDLAAFLDAVLDYTGAPGFDIVAHSLGVTVTRKTLQQRPDLFAKADDLVLIAGANHGTSVCRGIEDTWWGCDEIAPGTAWLDELNGDDETPDGPTYTTIYDGSGVADQFYVNGGAFDDSQSPRLEGAENIQLPGTAHNTLARGEEPFGIYLPILQSDELEPTRRGGPPPHAGPPPRVEPPPRAGPSDATPSAADLPTTGAGLTTATIALPLVAIRRRRRG